MKSFVSFQKPFMGKEKARSHSAIVLVIWSFPYTYLAHTLKFLWIVRSESMWCPSQVDGWMDGFTIGYWCFHRFKECSMAQALPYAGSTIAVRLVIPKNKTPPRLQLLGKHNHAIEKKM